LDLLKYLITTLFEKFGTLNKAFMIGLIVIAIFSVWKRQRYLGMVYLCFFITAVASYLHMFPVESRLWFYIYPAITLIIYVGIDKLLLMHPVGRWHWQHLLVGIISLGLLLFNTGISYYWDTENTYWAKEELNTEIAYLKAHIKAGEGIYVCRNSVPGFKYSNGYHTNLFGQYDNEVMYGEQILGTDIFGVYYDGTKDYAFIEGKGTCYIVMNNTLEAGNLYEELQSQGYLSLVSYEYETPLWYYSDTMTENKTSFSIEQEKENEITLTNTGASYINPVKENVELLCVSTGETVTLPDMIAPGESVTLSVTKGWDTSYALQNEYKVIATYQ
jgi:hypothetical protein